MGAILVTLAIFSPFFRRKELQSMKLETRYFEALKMFQVGALDEASLLKEGMTHFKNLGLSPVEAKQRVEKDLTLVNLSI